MDSPRLNLITFDIWSTGQKLLYISWVGRTLQSSRLLQPWSASLGREAASHVSAQLHLIREPMLFSVGHCFCPFFHFHYHAQEMAAFGASFSIGNGSDGQRGVY